MDLMDRIPNVKSPEGKKTIPLNTTNSPYTPVNPIQSPCSPICSMAIVHTISDEYPIRYLFLSPMNSI